MKRKRPAPNILQRSAAKNQKSAPGKPQRKHPSTSTAPAAPTPPASWRCASVVDQQASTAVERMLRAKATGDGGCALKTLTLAAGNQAKAATHAVTCETLKHMPVLEAMLDITDLRRTAPRGLHPNGPAERIILKHKDALQAALQQHLQRNNAPDVESLLPATHPQAPSLRTARVNTLKSSVDAVVAHFAAAGISVQADPWLPTVIHVPPCVHLFDHELVANGHLVLQGWSSCLPAAALAPEGGWAVLDACAAPGNKTSQLAALVGPNGRVVACDRDQRRLRRLQATINTVGATAFVEAHHVDFLSLDPTDPKFADVRGLLLDPSCSGSGTTASRGDALLLGTAAPATPPQRVAQLARFQQAALRHALRFPGLRRLVYSTCSVHREENEDVVAAVLAEAHEAGFELADALPGWPRRGLAVVEGSVCLVRVDAAQDGAEGFFVALFVKKRPQRH